jgi:hypothetical protein
MVTPSKDDVLSFDVLVNIRDSLKAMEKFSRSMKKSMKEIATSGQKMGKQNEKASREGKKATDEWGESVEKLNEAYEYHDKLLKDRGDSIRELRALYAKSDKEARKNMAGQIEFLEKNYKLQLRAAKVAKTTRMKGGLGARMFTPGLKKAISDIRGPGGMKQALEDAGEKLKEPLESFLRKDANGLVEKAARGFTGMVARGFHGGRLFSRVGARSLNRRGDRAIMAGKAAGGVKGSFKQAGGEGMKAMGDLLGGLGKLIRPLATLGPILQASLVGLVKLFLDLDAEVREFNKGIMDSASNLEFLGKAGGSVEAAVMDMKDALRGARDAATDASFNNALGISKDTHTAILNTLTQEGVAFGKLSADAGKTAEGMKALTQDIVKMGVAYSRGLGVPLQEITSLQAEMMVEMGKSVDETRQSFAMMSTAAEGSGIAGNKFFNVIRSLSTDLGLFNLRLEDSVAVLSKIGKVMSPRNAQKFMQEATQGMKGMGRQEKLRMSLLAGSGKTKEIVQKDIARKSSALMAKISEKTGESQVDLLKRFQAKGYAGIKSSIDQFGKESGTLAQSAIEVENQRTQANKGEYGTAMATADLGVGGSLELMRSALTVFSKGQYKSISDALGDMSLEQVAETLGKSDEQVKQAAMMEKAIDAQRDELKKMPGANADAIDKMGWDDVIATMTEGMKSALGADGDIRSMEQKMYDLSAEQGQQTQSYQEKIANFIDWVMNALYNVLIDIYDAITTIWPGSGGKTKEKRALYKTGDANLIGAYDQSVDKRSGKLDPEAFLKKVTPIMAERLKGLGSSEERRAKVARSVGMASAEGISEMGGEQYEYGHRKDRILQMAQSSGIDPALIKGLEDTLNSLSSDYTGDIDLMQVMKQLGFTAEDQAKFLSRAMEKVNMVDLVDLGKALGPSGTLPGAAAPTSPTGPVAVTAEAAETTAAQLETVVEENKKTQAILEQSGTKIAPATLKESAKGVEASMLSALRTALFEYYMYSGTDRGTLLTAMNQGGVTDPREMAQRFGATSVQTGGTQAALAGLAKPVVAQPNAGGGLVTGVARGMAVVAAQGEGLASVGKGERIVPSGGGGTGPGVNVVVNGIGGPDLARLIEGKVVEGIREYRRREKYN